ncbi:hypothetical protein BW731_02685 [Vagococcus martis]|uniref:Uncharacterized protein n=1 Tax=Vagococcus martis TaxID=1768210 RepID=A0A1V4DF82_9ENTE|nr:hypothetical protein [Vagococcus martis]OPF87194.1 hypothetical protein BW731_02685 [Vagococcus martis]
MSNYVLLFLGVIYMCSKSFEFEKITRLEFVILPIYSLIMFFITMNWSIFNLFLLMTLLVLSIFIGKYQSSRVEFEKIGAYDDYQRPVILIKKTNLIS